MNRTILPSQTAWRNSDERAAAVLSRIDDNDIGGHETIDQASAPELMAALWLAMNVARRAGR